MVGCWHCVSRTALALALRFPALRSPTGFTARLSPITTPPRSPEAHQKSGSLPPLALPGFNSTMTPSDYCRHRRLSATFRPLPSCPNGSPPITRTTIPVCRAQYPGGPNGCMCRLLPRHAAFPRYSGGSASATSLSSLLRLHSRYGSLDCSTAQGGLCHEDSAKPFTQPAARQLPKLSTTLRVNLTPLAVCAFGAH
jgi:hypothetical protein